MDLSALETFGNEGHVEGKVVQYPFFEADETNLPRSGKKLRSSSFTPKVIQRTVRSSPSCIFLLIKTREAQRLTGTFRRHAEQRTRFYAEEVTVTTSVSLETCPPQEDEKRTRVTKIQARDHPQQIQAEHSKMHEAENAAWQGAISNRATLGTPSEQNHLRHYPTLHKTKRRRKADHTEESTLLLPGSVQSTRQNDSVNLRESNRIMSSSGGVFDKIVSTSLAASTNKTLLGKVTPAHRWVRTASTVRGNRLNSTMTRKNRPPALISRTEYEVSHSIRDIIRQRSKEERAAESKSRVKRIMDTPFASENHQATDASSKAANKIGRKNSSRQKIPHDTNIHNLDTKANVVGHPDGSFPVAPQVLVVDGRIVVNEKSLTVSAMDDRASTLRDFIRVEESGVKLNSATYSNYTKAEKWTREDTDFFYEALRQFGTDFSLLQRLFPGRSRRQIKKKYLVEDKVNPSRVEAAINNLEPRPQLYESLISLLKAPEQNAGVEVGRGLLANSRGCAFATRHKGKM